MPRPVLPTAAAVSTMIALSLGAQQSPPDTTRLAPMVVTATRVPIASASSPATTSVVTGDELRRRGVTSIADALRTIPGITFAQAVAVVGAPSLFLLAVEGEYHMD